MNKKITLSVLGAMMLTTTVGCGMNQMAFQPGFQPGFQAPQMLRAQTASVQMNQRVLVGFKGELTPQRIAQMEKQYGLKFQKSLPKINVAVFSGNPNQSMGLMQNDPGLSFVGPDESPRRITEQPQYVQALPARGQEDPMMKDQWSLQAVDALKAWEVTKGANVIAAVVDTGVDLKHPDLEANLVPGYNAEDPGQLPQDGHYHGTHVAGIIGAVQNNGQGITGIAPQVKIMPVRAISNGGVAEVADGIVWATDNGARVINLSLGWDYPSASVEETIRRAIKYAIDKNVVICAAMSNSSQFNPRSVPDNLANKPGFEGGVIGVGNIDVNNRRNGAYGDWKNISSPGTQIMSTLPNNRYGNLTGTSMATPMVVGIASLILSQNPNLKNSEVKSRIMASAVDLGAPGIDDQFGAGRINAFGALKGTFLR